MSVDDADEPSSTDESDRLSDQQFGDSDSEGRSFQVEELADAVREDPSLVQEEKQLNINNVKADDDADFFCEMAGAMRQLIKHRHVTVPRIRVLGDDGTVEYMEPHRFTGGSVVAVWGSGPHGLVKILSRSRSGSGHASIVSRDAFAPIDEGETSTADDENGEADAKERHNDADTTDADDEADLGESNRSEDDNDDWTAEQISSDPPDDSDEGSAATPAQGSNEDDPGEERNGNNDDPEFRSALDW